MQTKFLAIMLAAPVVFSSQEASASDFFGPEKISTEINLGTLSGKTKNGFMSLKKVDVKSANWTGNTVTPPFLKAPLTGS